MNKNLEILQNLEVKMKGSISSLNYMLNGLRTGRASTTLIDSIRVNAYGNDLSLHQVSSISTPNAKTLLIQIWDKGLIASVKESILNSGLGLVPNVEGQLVRLNLPNLSETRRKELVKKANEYSEKAKVAIRNSRRNI